MQLTIKLLSLLRQKQDTYTYEYFHEPPVIPQKLKEVGQSLLWNVRTCLWNVYLTNKQNKNKIERHPQSHTLIFSYLSEVSWCLRCTFFFLVRKAHRHAKKCPWIFLSLVWGQLILSQWLFTEVRKTHKCHVFVPAVLHLLLLDMIYGSGKKRGRPLCLTLYKTFCHSLNNLLLPKTGLQVR